MNTKKHTKKVLHLPLFTQKNHKAILFSLCLFLMLPATFVHAQRLYTTDGVNVRAKPNSSSKILTSISQGTAVIKTGSSGNWIAVNVNGIKGYIYKSYLSGNSKKVTSSTATASYRAVINANRVNLRARPSFSSRVKGSLSLGQKVTVYSTKGSWKKIKTASGKQGYVYNTYIGKKNVSSPTSNPVATTPSLSGERSKAIAYAQGRLGNIYSQEKRDQQGYADCSSLVRDAYRYATGKFIGNTTYQQLENMHAYLYSISSINNASVGDLVYHRNGGTHVGIYLGNRRVLHASQTAGVVKISTFSSSSTYWDTACNAAAYCANH